MPVYKKVNKNFFKKWTNEMSYVLGFFAADGYITVNRRGGQFWCIQITDKELLESIKKVIGSDHKISIKISKKVNEKISYRLQIGSIEMCNDLRKIGFSENKTKSLVIPYIPKKYFPDFVRGYFDGDGNVWMGNMHKERLIKTNSLLVYFTSCSYKFLSELKTRLNMHGLSGGSIYKSKKHDFCRLQFSTLDSLKLYDFMYNRDTNLLNGLFLERKKKVFQKFVRLRL